jgi:hypothetical protein
MGKPEEYDWGLTPEVQRRFEFSVSVAFEIGPAHLAALAAAEEPNTIRGTE